MVSEHKFIPLVVKDFSRTLGLLGQQVLVDARMRKHSQPEPQIHLAELTIGLGPNFIAGETIHLAVETGWGEDLGKIIEKGATNPLVRRGPRYRAIGVDIDPVVIESGMANRVARLTPAARSRVRLVNANVMKVRNEPVDAIAALYFSYWVFKERRVLLDYFRCARRALTVDGMLFLDAFGGHDAFREIEETTRHRRFTYVWDQERYWPVTGELLCHIHFRFPDGSRLRKAFTYDWRLWTLPELRELLTEAGFRDVSVYWEGDDGKGGGNGEFTPHPHGDADATWIAYVVAAK